MASTPHPGELTPSPPPSPSFEEFQRHTSLMTSCTLLWKELSDHFTSLDHDLRRQSDSLKRKIQSLDSHTNDSLQLLDQRESTLAASVDAAIRAAEKASRSALELLDDHDGQEVDDGEGLLLKLRRFCVRMDHKSFWRFVIVRKKQLDVLRTRIPVAFLDCVDPPRLVLAAISEVFPVGADKGSDLGWACVLLLESLIPVLVTPRVREEAEGMAEEWKAGLEERGGVENVRTPDVHTFLQHLVTFEIFKGEDVVLYRKLVIGSAWRKQMPKLALSLGLGDTMPDMIEELISRGQQVDAVHFTHEIGLVDKFPPVPLLKAFLEDAKKAVSSILEDPNNTGKAAYLATRKELSAIRAVLKCIEEYKLEAEFPPENLRKRLDQLEKTKVEKKKSPHVPANKRTRICNNGPIPPAKAGRHAKAYVSSFPATAPTFVSSPSLFQYPAGVPPYPQSPMYSSQSPPYAYFPEVVSPPTIVGNYPGAPVNYPFYGGYAGGLAPPSYPPQAYY